MRQFEDAPSRTRDTSSSPSTAPPIAGFTPSTDSPRHQQSASSSATDAIHALVGLQNGPMILQNNTHSSTALRDRPPSEVEAATVAPLDFATERLPQGEHLNDADALTAFMTETVRRSEDAVPPRDTNAFYGPTARTYIHLLATTQVSLVDPFDDLEGEAAVDTGSPQLRRVLLEEVWKSCHLTARVVDQELFNAHRQLGQRSQYYSTFVENALLACAARMSTSSAVTQCGRYFADQAKAAIVHELESPSIATIQGFLLLSDYVFTIGQDRLGWTYSGKLTLSVSTSGVDSTTNEVRDRRPAHL